MTKDHDSALNRKKLAQFRFSIIGPLLAAPPETGQLKRELKALAEKSWTHPINGEFITFHPGSIERWFYRARLNSKDPIGSLMKPRKSLDGPGTFIPEPLKDKIRAQYDQHKEWSCQLHYDNLKIVNLEEFGENFPSYSTVRRFMRCQGMTKRKQVGKYTAGQLLAEERIQKREVRSFELEHVGALFHLDFHHGSFQILDSDGKWRTPLCFAMLDDRSRVCCHVQWYFSEDTEHLVHGLIQGFMKRGLPRTLMSDNGAAMISEEYLRGLQTLGILGSKTLPYSPYQNGKQERFWGVLEGRLVKMLPPDRSLTLKALNDATMAWVEMEYNKSPLREMGVSPVERYVSDPNVLRLAPGYEELKMAFRQRLTRRLRKSDCTITVDGVRFEIPSLYRHLENIVIHYARWDLSFVHIADSKSDKPLLQIYPLSLQGNANSIRRAFNNEHDEVSSTKATSQEMAPLLQKYMGDFAATGIPSPYLPKDE